MINFLRITLGTSSAVFSLVLLAQTATAADIESMAQITSVSQLTDVQPTD